MSTHDYIATFSPYSDSNPANFNKDLEEADLRLSLSLPAADFHDNGANWEKEYPRDSNDESLTSMRESQQSFGNWVAREQKQQCQHGIAGEASYGEEERERRLFGLQMSGPSHHQKQGSSEQAGSTEDSDNEAVGWPPLQTCRKFIISAHQMSSEVENESETMSRDNFEPEGEREGSSNFVKVIMDGMPIGRKVDLNAHNSYDTLAVALEHIFQQPTILNELSISNNSRHSSNYLLTYLNSDGNWMLVGDAPWEVFVKSVRRLRIAKM